MELDELTIDGLYFAIYVMGDLVAVYSAIFLLLVFVDIIANAIRMLRSE